MSGDLNAVIEAELERLPSMPIVESVAALFELGAADQGGSRMSRKRRFGFGFELN